MAWPRKWNAAKVKLEIGKLHEKLGRQPVKRDSSSLYNLARQYYGTWNNALQAAGYSIKNFQNPKIPQITPDLAYFVGLVITDGHLVYNEHRRAYDIRLYTSYPEEKDLIIKLIKNLFSYEAKARRRQIYGFNKVPNYELIISSKKLVLFLHKQFDVPLGAKSNKIMVPIKLIRDDTLFFNFLRGLIDGDGNISNRVKLNSKSKSFLERIKMVLNEFEISTSLCDTGTTYELAINKKEHIKKLYGQLYQTQRFCYPRKKLKFDELTKAL